MTPWLDRFLEAQAAERGAALNSLLAYRRDIEAYHAHLAARARDVETAERADIESYLIACEAEGLAASIIAEQSKRRA